MELGQCVCGGQVSSGDLLLQGPEGIRYKLQAVSGGLQLFTKELVLAMQQHLMVLQLRGLSF